MTDQLRYSTEKGGGPLELRTRAEQRELDTGRVTLRKTGRELQKAGSELRTDHIDSSKTIEIRKQAGGGSQKTITGRGTIAESSSPDIAGVVRTLPPDLRKHWDMLTETKKREIIEKAYASANRKDAGEATTSLGQGKNLVRRYGNTPQPERRKDTRQCSEDTEWGNDKHRRAEDSGTNPVVRRIQDHTDSRDINISGSNRFLSATEKKQIAIRSDMTGNDSMKGSSPEEIIREEVQETSSSPVPVRQRAMRMEQIGRKENSNRSLQASDRKTGNQSGRQNTNRELPESGYKMRLAGRTTRSRNSSSIEAQDSEIRTKSASTIRMKETGTRRKQKEKTDNRTNAQVVGKEYGKREILKKNERATEEKTGLRIVDQEVEDSTELRLSGQSQESNTGLRTTERKPERSSELRLAGGAPGMPAEELRTLQKENFQKSFSEGVVEKNAHTGSDKDSRRKTDKSGNISGRGNNIGNNSKASSTGIAPVKGSGRKEERGDQRKSKELRSKASDAGGQGRIGQKRNAAASAEAGSERRETSDSDRVRQGDSPSRRSHRNKNTPEDAAPSQGKKNSAIRLIRRKKKDDGTGNTSRHFVSSFTNLVKADFARAGQIGQEQKRIQVESTLQEYQDETASHAFRIAVTPLRIAAKTAARAVAKKIVAGIVSATTAAINMLLPMLILLLPVLLIAGILPGLVGTIASEEEEGESYNVSGGSIVEYAREWIGKTKYIYGAGRNGPLDWQDYADCSSFVHGVFSHFGVEIGWTTVEQENSGTKVCENSLSKAEPGDIVLFYDGGSIRSGGSGHVGIYSGSGNMVHNSSSKGTVVEAPVSYQNRPYVVRRITIPFTEDRSGGGGNATKGHRKDPTNYSQSQLELIWAIVAQEDNGSYKGALAVISSAMNRTESSKWSYCGRTAMEQLTAPGQYCYSNDTYWMARLGGNVPDYVKTAVNDCLKKGIRNHNHTSFRSTKGKVTGPDAVQIGGNWFFDY